MIISDYMLLKYDYILCSARTWVSDFAWKAWNSLDCLRVPSVFESVTATTMVSKKMSNRFSMKSTRKHMNGIWNVTRDVSPLKVVLIDTVRSPNSSMTALWIRRVAAWNLLMGWGDAWVLPLGCAYFCWRSRCMPQMMVVDRLHVVSVKWCKWLCCGNLTCSAQE